MLKKENEKPAREKEKEREKEVAEGMKVVAQYVMRRFEEDDDYKGAVHKLKDGGDKFFRYCLRLSDNAGSKRIAKALADIRVGCIGEQNIELLKTINYMHDADKSRNVNRSIELIWEIIFQDGVFSWCNIVFLLEWLVSIAGKDLLREAEPDTKNYIECFVREILFKVIGDKTISQWIMDAGGLERHLKKTESSKNSKAGRNESMMLTAKLQKIMEGSETSAQPSSIDSSPRSISNTILNRRTSRQPSVGARSNCPTPDSLSESSQSEEHLHTRARCCASSRIPSIVPENVRSACACCSKVWCSLCSNNFFGSMEDFIVHYVTKHANSGIPRTHTTVDNCCGITNKPKRPNMRAKYGVCSRCGKIWCRIEKLCNFFADKGNDEAFHQHKQIFHKNEETAITKCGGCFREKEKNGQGYYGFCHHCQVFYCTVEDCEVEFAWYPNTSVNIERHYAAVHRMEVSINESINKRESVSACQKIEPNANICKAWQ